MPGAQSLENSPPSNHLRGAEGNKKNCQPLRKKGLRDFVHLAVLMLGFTLAFDGKRVSSNSVTAIAAVNIREVNIRGAWCACLQRLEHVSPAKALHYFLMGKTADSAWRPRRVLEKNLNHRLDSNAISPFSARTKIRSFRRQEDASVRVNETLEFPRLHSHIAGRAAFCSHGTSNLAAVAADQI